MGDPTIVIPSMGRAGEVTTHTVFGSENVTLCVPVSEGALYRSAHPDVKVVTHPDAVVGISQKRQWIYEEWGDVTMVDDDTVAIIHLEHVPDEKECRLSPVEAVRLAQRLHREAAEFGAYLYGLASTVAPLVYQGTYPFRTVGWVNAGFTGLRAGSGLAYHPGIVCSEDFWISALNAHRHRKVWVDQRYGLLDRAAGQGTMATPGGMAVTRSLAAQANDNRILERHFGDAVRARTKSARVHARHDLQRKLVIPW